MLELAREFPTVKVLIDENREYYEEDLPHLFLDEVASHAIAMYEADPEDAELHRLLDYLERQFIQGPESVQDLIHVGFLEGLGGPPERGWEVRRLLGPRLRTAIEQIWPADS